MSQVLKTAPARAQDALELYGGQVLFRFDKAKHAYHVEGEP